MIAAKTSHDMFKPDPKGTTINVYELEETAAFLYESIANGMLGEDTEVDLQMPISNQFIVVKLNKVRYALRMQDIIECVVRRFQ